MLDVVVVVVIAVHLSSLSFLCGKVVRISTESWRPELPSIEGRYDARADGDDDDDDERRLVLLLGTLSLGFGASFFFSPQSFLPLASRASASA